MTLLAILAVEASGGPTVEPLARPLEVGVALLDLDSLLIVDVWERLSNPGPYHWQGDRFDTALLEAGIERDWLVDALPAAQVSAGLRAFLVSHGVRCVTAFDVDTVFHPLLLGGPHWLGGLCSVLRVGPSLQAEATRAAGARVRRAGPLGFEDSLERFRISPLRPLRRAGHAAQNGAMLLARLLNHGMGPARQGRRHRLTSFDLWAGHKAPPLPSTREGRPAPLHLSGATLPLINLGAIAPTAWS